MDSKKEAWMASEPSFKWGEFLEARSALIQYWSNEGKSYGEIANLVSADAAQVQRIDENMQRLHRLAKQENI